LRNIKKLRMQTHTIFILEKEYTLYINYQQDEELRQELNRLTQQVWEFDFENFYQSGFWKDQCLIYSIFHQDKIISHVTLSFFETHVDDKVMKLAQIGTVMTDPDYQKLGLARFLMTYIFKEWNDHSDGMFLFANDTVLDFYPKFGFVAVEEFQSVINHSFKNNGEVVRVLNLDLAEDFQLFENYVDQSIVNSALETKNKDIIFFYAYANPEFGFRNSIYYIENLKTIVIAQIDDDILTIFQCYQLEVTELERVISALVTDSINEVRFGFSPIIKDMTLEEYKEEDLTLFVSESLCHLFQNQKLMIPLLSHT